MSLSAVGLKSRFLKNSNILNHSIKKQINNVIGVEFALILCRGIIILNQILAIAAGGALGAVARYGMSTGVYAVTGRAFPYGTLAVNVFGSLVMGFLFVMLIERMTLSPDVRAMLLIGLLGSFTTFSTFSMETLTLIQQAEMFKAAANIILSVVLCLGAAWLGVIVARGI